MVRLFLAGRGPVVRPEFTAASLALGDAGYEVEHGYYCDLTPPGPDKLPWQGWTLPDLAECDGVALLDDWEESPGTQDEVDFAIGRGIRCRPVSCWLNHPGGGPCKCPSPARLGSV